MPRVPHIISICDYNTVVRIALGDFESRGDVDTGFLREGIKPSTITEIKSTEITKYDQNNSKIKTKQSNKLIN